MLHNDAHPAWIAELAAAGPGRSGSSCVLAGTTAGLGFCFREEDEAGRLPVDSVVGARDGQHRAVRQRPAQTSVALVT